MDQQTRSKEHLLFAGIITGCAPFLAALISLPACNDLYSKLFGIQIPWSALHPIKLYFYVIFTVPAALGFILISVLISKSSKLYCKDKWFVFGVTTFLPTTLLLIIPLLIVVFDLNPQFLFVFYTPYMVGGHMDEFVIWGNIIPLNETQKMCAMVLLTAGIWQLMNFLVLWYRLCRIESQEE